MKFLGRAAMRQCCACLLKVVVAVSVSPIFMTGLAIAQPLPVYSNTVAWPGLRQDDIDRMGAAAARLYEGRSIGTVERWMNPESKNAGEIKLARSFTARGMPCHQLDYVIRLETARNHPNSYVVNWCKVTDGEWKIVELPRPR